MRKKVLALVMTLAMVLSLIPVTALAEEGTEDQETSVSTFTVDGLTYEVTEDTNSVNVTGWNKEKLDVVIPEEVTDSDRKKYPVVGISASSGFQGSNLTSIEIQAAIETLEDATFSGCTKLTTVKLPNTIKKIGNQVFRNCNSITTLEGIDWSLVTSIGNYAFAFNGQNAESIILNEQSFQNLQSLGASAFAGAVNLTGKLVIPEGIETIGADTFKGTGITSITLPNSVEKIGMRAFANCTKLETVHIGKNKESKLNSIGTWAFKGANSVNSFIIETSEDNILSGNNAANFPTGITPTYTVATIKGSNIYPDNETTLQDAVDAANDGDIIVIGKSVLLEDTVTIQRKKITITDGGNGFTVLTKKDFSGPVFQINADAELTLEGSIEYNCSRIDGHFAKVLGNLTLNSSSISGPETKQSTNVGAVDVEGGHFTMNGGEISNTYYVVKNSANPNGTVYIHSGGEFTMNDGAIHETHSGGQHCGAVYVEQNGTFTMKGGKISDSEVGGMYTASVLLDGANAKMLMKGGEISGNNNTDLLENSTSGVAVSNGASFVMEEGTIANNNGLRGAGVLVGTTTDMAYSEETAATFTMNGGEISNNTATQNHENSGGGGVFVQNNAEFIMNNGIITGNTAEDGMGGGVATSNQDMNGGGCFTMNGGTISNNFAYCGGGVYSYSKNTVTLRGGYILNNRAGSNGGGVYVSKAPYNITLENALVTGNTANVMGGGIWSCPTGTVQLGSNSAVYDNTAAVAGDDIAFLSKDSGYYSTFGCEILGGGTVTWYKDNAVYGTIGPLGGHDNWRYNSEEPGEPVEGASESTGNYSLKAVISEESKKPAENATTHLFIQGNIAERGGGVGTNGEVIFSGTTTFTEPMCVVVNKVWKNDNGNHPATVTVNLIRATKDGTDRKETIDSVTLSEANGWTYTFENLSVDYTYTVTENAVTKYETEITKNESQKENVVSYTITNTYKRGGGGHTPGGDVPTGLDLKNHYGYIIGYPVDYYTGEPTTDQTKKPVRPEGKITRAEVATIYFRMLTEENRVANWNQVSGFSDVKRSAWYNNAISTLTKAGILKGYEDGTFQPDGYITRAEFATIAIRFFSGVYEGEDLFPDIKDHWARDYINNAADKGLVKGYEDGTFGPDRYITRAEAVTLVNRTLNRHPHNDGLDEDMLRWPDNMDTSKWYYADMQEATNSHETDKNKSNSEKEYWSKTLPIRDWEALEKEWSNANSAPGEGEVV